ncbi:MAG: NYN domain-containing protein [Bacteroidetes bacterium]|nr:NYN domain-containing protein [Bacteroidota bacterium]
MPTTTPTIRVNFYFDGFNFYYGLKSKGWKSFYWLDLVSFSEKFLRSNQEIQSVNYFSAVPHERGMADRQDLLFSANKLNPKFNLFLGKYMKKHITCYNCATRFQTYEEKQTDVQIATKVIRDVVLDKCDVSILITADSDLIPPIDFIREVNPLHKVVVLFPPNRSSFDWRAKANAAISLDRHFDKFQNSMLPNAVTLPNGYVCYRPGNWV